MQVNIITDSASDLRQDEAKQRGITVLPMMIRIDGDTFLDGVTIDHDTFYRRLADCTALPSTSQVTPHAFSEQLQRACGDGAETVIVTISGELSGTAQSAAVAARDFDGRAYVVDSRNACVGERILVEYAVMLRNAGLGAEEIAAQLESAKGRIRLFAAVDTLEYVVKGGRLSKAAGLAGALFNIRPVVGIVDGALKVLGKAVGARKTDQLMTQMIRACGEIDRSMPCCFGYSGLDDKKLQAYLESSRTLWQLEPQQEPVCVIGSTVGTYSGPGTVAVAFFVPE